MVDPATVLTTHLTEMIKDNLAELLTYAETQKLLDELSKDYHKLIEDLVPDRISVGGIQRVLQGLLAERISIRDLALILEAIGEAVGSSQNVVVITEYVRARLARQISNAVTAEAGYIPILTLSPEWEQAFAEALVGQGDQRQLAMAPSKLQGFITRLREAFEQHAMRGELPVLVTTPAARPTCARSSSASARPRWCCRRTRSTPRRACARSARSDPGDASQDGHRARRPAGDGQAARAIWAPMRSSSPPSRWMAGCASPARSRTTRSISALCSPRPRPRRAWNGWRGSRRTTSCPPAVRDRLLAAVREPSSTEPVAALGHALHQLYPFRAIAAACPTAAQRPARRRQDGIGRQARRPRRARGPDGRGAEHGRARAGGIEQLRALLAPLAARPQAASEPRRLERLIGDAGAELILIDSPGINPFRPADLGKLSQALEMSGALPVLVLDAGTGSADSADMAQTFAALGSRWLFATKLDVARRLGGVLAAADAGLALAEAGIGPTIGRGLAH